jgi:hypothetical protein
MHGIVQDDSVQDDSVQEDLAQTSLCVLYRRMVAAFLQ